MMFAIGWAVVRSSRQGYSDLAEGSAASFSDRLDTLDLLVNAADDSLFGLLEDYLSGFTPPDLDWHFRRHMNNVSGVLQFSTSRNHRGSEPSALEILRWLALNGPESYGLVYLHDDEDFGGQAPANGGIEADHSNEFRVWRLLHGRVEEHADPFFSPIVPTLDSDECV